MKTEELAVLVYGVVAFAMALAFALTAHCTAGVFWLALSATAVYLFQIMQLLGFRDTLTGTVMFMSWFLFVVSLVASAQQVWS